MSTEYKAAHGLIVPLITPLQRVGCSLCVDIQSLQKIINHVISGGAHTIFTLGNAGLFRYLTVNQKFSVIDAVLSITARRTPVIIGVSADTQDESCQLARYAEASGADGLVYIPLYGTGDPEQKIENLIRETITIPIYLYNNPSLQQNISLPIDIIRKYSSHNRIAGIKNSTIDFTIYKEMAILQNQRFFVYQGSAENIVKTRFLETSKEIPNFILHGFVPVQANARPALFSDYYIHGNANDDMKIDKTIQELNSIPRTIEEMVALKLLLPDTLDVFKNK